MANMPENKPPAPVHTALSQWELQPPPGCRFVNQFGGGVVLQFPKGKEQDLLQWLHSWIDHMAMPHVYAPPVWTEAQRQNVPAETAKETPAAKNDTDRPPGPNTVRGILNQVKADGDPPADDGNGTIL